VETFDIPGAPDAELRRSPAAAAVGRMAAASGLLLSHFEHRVHLPLPPSWTAGPAEGEARGWQRGVLPESKYDHFRHDNAIGSFHPGHRAQWTAHELCHRLVGFAWRPGAPPFFQALAARLAEALPVALWYFFDEIGLRRCPDHVGQGPLFGDYCPACEAAALLGPVPAQGDAGAGHAFLERELQAVRESRRTGRPIAHRYATLDLSSDGIAYVAAHAPRLATPEFAEFVERFHAGRGLWHASLDELEARVRAVAEALVGGQPPAPLSGTRADWIAQDLGWRLIQVRAETEGEATDELTRLIDWLGTPGEAAFAAVVDGYRALFEDWILPEPDDVFAVGYDLPRGAGRSVRQVREGLESVCPAALALLDEDLADDFVAQDAPARTPLGRRFAAFLAARHPGPAAEVAAVEAALAQPPAPDPTAALGVAGARDARRRWAAHLELLRCEIDVLPLIDAVNAGRRPRPKRRPHALLVGRSAEGEVVLAEVSEATAQAFTAGRVPDDDRNSLESLGFLLPEAWSD
jgi:hypothetical protein